MSADGFLPAGGLAAGIAAAAARAASRRIEPEHRRTHAPVHKHSRLAGRFEATFWGPFDPRDKSRFMQAAERFERVNRKPGSRYGPLGMVALEVLRELMRLVDFKTGRLEPAIETIMGRLRRCRDAVVRALARLRDHGFLDWLRRYEATGEAGSRGPQVKQITNAYTLMLPKAALRLLGAAFGPAPAPVDEEERRAAMVAQARAYAVDDPQNPDGAVGRAAQTLGRKVAERESAKRTESGLG